MIILHIEMEKSGGTAYISDNRSRLNYSFEYKQHPKRAELIIYRGINPATQAVRRRVHRIGIFDERNRSYFANKIAATLISDYNNPRMLADNEEADNGSS